MNAPVVRGSVATATARSLIMLTYSPQISAHTEGWAPLLTIARYAGHLPKRRVERSLDVFVSNGWAEAEHCDVFGTIAYRWRTGVPLPVYADGELLWRVPADGTEPQPAGDVTSR